MVGKVAAKYGCQQVLWLSGRDEKLTEVGSMNIFIFWKNEKGGEQQSILKVALFFRARIGYATTN